MKGELTTYQGDKVKVGELVLFGMFGDRGMLVGGTEQDAMVAQIKTKDGVLVGFREPVSVKNSFRKYHGDWKPTTKEQTMITAMRAKVVKSNQKPLKDMSTSEVKQLRVILRVLPDSTLWITEEGKDSLERNVASWNPAHRPDRTEKSWVGGYILGQKVSDNAADWLRKVVKTFNLNKKDIVAEAWRGGGLRHTGKSPFSIVKTLRGKDKSTDAGETSLQSIHDSRSELSKSSDERQEHSLVVEPDDSRLERWMQDAGSMDVRGIDTPRGAGKKRAVKAKAKPRRRMDSPTSVRGLRRSR